MTTSGKKSHRLALIVSLMLWFSAPAAQAAQRELHWDALDVEARLQANGVLDVVERHTMVFTGDWNGGERVFNVRSRQKLDFLGMQRIDAKTGSPMPMQEVSVPNRVDEFTWKDRRTLRWRSRLPSDPPFAGTPLTYVLHYKLSGILVKDDDSHYRLNHDFAFPNRPGPIESFTLNLILDRPWQPPGDDEYGSPHKSGRLDPGESFVVNIPLRYSGSEVPIANDIRRSPQIVVATVGLLGAFALLLFLFVNRERTLGRFVPVEGVGVDSAWIENNILTHPAEVVGAAWDGRIGAPEVIALIARMTAEGKLESKVEGSNAMRLQLKVSRDKLIGYERALVDGLFFDQRAETSTKEIRQHYKSSGFDPATIIRPTLENHVKAVLPSSNTRIGHRLSVVLYVAGLLLLALSSYSEPILGSATVGVAIVSLFLVAILQIPGLIFRSRIDWGLKAATFLLVPALVVVLGTATFLWWYTNAGEVDLPWTMLAGLAALALGIANSSINGLKSRQTSAAIAFRKRLAMGRSFFLSELEKPHPNLRDGWYPWLLAFGLGKQVDVWSSRQTSGTTSASTWDHSTSTINLSPSSSSSTSSGWSGGGGFSGGAGATGAWAAAAAGMAAGVAAPSSSSSSGSSSSSSGGSSGGGGGGGW